MVQSKITYYAMLTPEHRYEIQQQIRAREAACTVASSDPHGMTPQSTDPVWPECRSAKAFEVRLRRPSGSKFCDLSVIGRATRAFEEGFGATGCRCSKTITEIKLNTHACTTTGFDEPYCHEELYR